MSSTASTSTSKIALVTGASSGIGRLSAIALSKAGWSVVLSGRRANELEATAAQCPTETLCVAGDVSDPAAVESLFKQTQDKFGRLDLLFNNAGIDAANGLLLEDIPLDKFQAVMNVNVTAHLLCTQQAFKIMKAQSPQGGRIINNGSISATSPRPNSAPYTMSKHAITGLTKCTALDGRKYNIACSQIDIGNAATAMGGHAAKGCPQADGSIREEPMMSAQNVGSAVVFIGGLPLDANVLNMELMASAMPFVGRG